jgi:hypothetical protein
VDIFSNIASSTAIFHEPRAGEERISRHLAYGSVDILFVGISNKEVSPKQSQWFLFVGKRITFTVLT